MFVCRVIAALVATASLTGTTALADPEAERREAQASETAAQRIANAWPSAGGSPAARFVEKLGERLGRAAPASPFPWRFAVIRDRSLQAFSIGGGRIYVSDGSVSICAQEGELAAVLAHEMGHQLGGHFAPAVPRPEDDLLGWLGLVAPSTPSVSVGGVRHVFDREKEAAADRISLRILSAAGYDPRVAVTLAERQTQRARTEASRRTATRRVGALRRLLVDVPHGGITDTAEFRTLHAELAAERPAD